ncbi:peroxiredoxin [Candidatus Uabimicrobium sp. HlEnr_7]|uniref:peroxiredoxin n=1 Tax=Candidatus Uabimicrobium helgolandensis TaxID=3095367 RepID=UPI003557A446
MIKVGETLPEVTFQQVNNGKIEDLTTPQIFSGKKAIIFAVPGAFTPTCSQKHLPGFVHLYNKLQEKGIDIIACTAVNDAYTMQAWQKALAAENIVMLADGGANFAKALGVDKDTGIFGGTRSKRYALVVNDTIIEHIFLEQPGEFSVSNAEAILTIL